MTHHKMEKRIRVQHIVHAAAAEFIRNGYEKTSMQQIAITAGMTKGGLYHHFRGKDDILMEAIKIFAEPIYEIMHSASRSASAQKAVQILISRYVMHWVQHPTELAFYFLSMVKAITLPRLQHVYDGYSETMIQFYQQLFIKGMQSGEFRRHDSYSRALALAMALDGAVGYLMIDKKANPKNFIHHLITQFVQDILIGRARELK
jgi:AcrR family transcriptional regulator